jgi:ethylmalonyl-CoA/methylmalonyl-CoA decarboxylase
MISQLLDAVHTLEDWSAGAALIIEGEGGSFCAGADLELVRNALKTREDGVLMSELMTCILGRLRSLPILSVAAVDGAAMGGGAELATATDWRVFAADAQLQFVQTKMGLSTGWGGTGRLAKLVGRSMALRLLLHSPRLDAKEARAVGLVEEVAADGEGAADAAMRLLVKPAMEQAAATETIRALKAAVAGHSALLYGTRGNAAETKAFGSVFGSESNQRAVDAALARIGSASKT